MNATYDIFPNFGSAAPLTSAGSECQRAKSVMAADVDLPALALRHAP